MCCVVIQYTRGRHFVQSTAIYPWPVYTLLHLLSHLHP
uniref:Uncharacterized protein n=1 Tax=Anguilla anguilla TaxID=7936 RepID=A0A0E9VFG5_ANGAN